MGSVWRRTERHSNHTELVVWRRGNLQDRHVNRRILERYANHRSVICGWTIAGHDEYKELIGKVPCNAVVEDVMCGNDVAPGVDAPSTSNKGNLELTLSPGVFEPPRSRSWTLRASKIRTRMTSSRRTEEDERKHGEIMVGLRSRTSRSRPGSRRCPAASRRHAVSAGFPLHWLGWKPYRNL